MVNIRKLGSLITIDLGLVSEEYKGAVLSVRHVGPGKVREWQVALRKLQNQEIGRIIALRRQFTAEEWPDLYASDFATPESTEDATAFAKRVLTDCAHAIIGNDVLEDQATPQAATDYVLAAGMGERVLPHLLSAQLPTKRDLFSADPSNPGPAGHPPAL
jgi:hypothetical protein